MSGLATKTDLLNTLPSKLLFFKGENDMDNYLSSNTLPQVNVANIRYEHNEVPLRLPFHLEDVRRKLKVFIEQHVLDPLPKVPTHTDKLTTEVKERDDTITGGGSEVLEDDDSPAESFSYDEEERPYGIHPPYFMYVGENIPANMGISQTPLVPAYHERIVCEALILFENKPPLHVGVVHEEVDELCAHMEAQSQAIARAMARYITPDWNLKDMMVNLTIKLSSLGDYPDKAANLYNRRAATSEEIVFNAKRLAVGEPVLLTLKNAFWTQMLRVEKAAPPTQTRGVFFFTHPVIEILVENIDFHVVKIDAIPYSGTTTLCMEIARRLRLKLPPLSEIHLVVDQEEDAFNISQERVVTTYPNQMKTLETPTALIRESKYNYTGYMKGEEYDWDVRKFRYLIVAGRDHLCTHQQRNATVCSHMM